MHDTFCGNKVRLMILETLGLKMFLKPLFLCKPHKN